MIKVLFICRNFDQMAGGIERMATLMMNEMIDRGFEVALITWDPEDAEPHYPLSKKVFWGKLNLGPASIKAGWFLRVRRQLALRRMVAQINPDVAIAFQVGTFLASRLATFGMGIPMIAAERNSPDLFDYVVNGGGKRARAEKILRLADVITVQIDGYRSKYPASLSERIIAIPNPVDASFAAEYPNENPGMPCRILNVGRLSLQKNQQFLIRAFAKIAVSNPTWELVLVGNGEKRGDIEKLIVELGVKHQVRLAGAVTDVDAWYCSSAFLAFPSLWEGFPNALVEAFSHGLPALGLQTTSGVKDLLVHNENGLLAAPDEDEFAAALQFMIDHDDFRRQCGRKARASVLNYEPAQIFDQWANLFENLASRR